MNQIFNINRFGRYTRYILSQNRWYYGVLLVACVIPASVLSFCGLEPDGARFLVGGLISMAVFCLSFLPNIELSKIGGFAREIAIPASWLEKMIVEIVVRFSPLAVPFCIHAIAYAIGFNGISSVTADGFSLATIAMILIWATLCFFCLSFNNGKSGNAMSGKKMVSTNLLMAIVVGLQGPNFVNNLARHFSPTISYILLLISAALLLASVPNSVRTRKLCSSSCTASTPSSKTSPPTSR